MMDLMWLFTVPVLKVAIKVGIGLASTFLLIQVFRWAFQAKPPNPFAKDSRKKRKPYVRDPRRRDAVLKQSFSPNRLPDRPDAIVIGSGIGGLTTAAVMAKSGKKVLVLEQHDQAGGCCHTFLDKGYEFDVGVHYIGQLGRQTLVKTLFDQITDGQLEWAPLDDEYDTVSIGYEDNRRYPIVSGRENWKKLLLKLFPKEESAISEFFEKYFDNKSFRNYNYASVVLKMIPLWLAKFFVRSGLLKYFIWDEELNSKTTKDVIQSLTADKDLQTVFCYCWGDYGTPPSKSGYGIMTSLFRHFNSDGGYYPVGGASEIAYNIIPVIERAGGRVLVKADVTAILYDGRKVMGVKVKKGEEIYNLTAPIVISNAGVYNTFETLLPKEVAEKSYFYSDIIKKELTEHSMSMISVFVGLDKSHDDLGLRRHNVWAFTANDAGESVENYMKLSAEEAMASVAPLMFVSFPSTKDPNWKLHPERENKSTCTIIGVFSWDWVKKWEHETVKRRGDDYEEIKKTIGQKLIDQTCHLFPQIKDHIDYIDIGTPVSNKYYIGQPNGEIYGLDHTKERFYPWMTARLRPETDIPGLYLTGQDVMNCGVVGGLFGGLLAAGSVLNRNVTWDLVNLHKELKKSKKTV